MGFQSSAGTILRILKPGSSWWTCTLTDGKVLSERTAHFDRTSGGLRPFDWSLDLVATGDHRRVKEVTLHTPDGQTATLLIKEPGTVFQFKIASMHILSKQKQVEAHLIGNVVDKETGGCVCHIWDRERGLIGYSSSVYAFGSWRDGILPLGALSFDVLGLQLN